MPESNFILKRVEDENHKTEKYNYDIKNYPGFFSYGEGIKARKKPISNKIRKLITRPKDFFKDIKIFRHKTK